ncbi:MAG: flippase-like domain-containing protein [Chloroflexi bacterium]|nr:flippase-like domain-containing protein [Chloroflexota bacterium]
MARTLRAPSPPLLAAPQLRWSSRQLGLTLGLLILLGWALAGLDDGGRLIAAARGLWQQPGLLILFLLTYTAAFGLRAAAWQMLIPAGPGPARLFAILQIALLANHLFPTKAGEIIRIGLLARRGVPSGTAVGSTTLARLLDFAALCLIALVLGPLAGGRLDLLLGSLAVPISAIGLGAFACYLLASGRLSPLWSRLPDRPARLAHDVQTALGATPSRRLVAAFGVVLLSWLLEAGALWSTARAAGVPLSFAVAAATTAFTIAFQAFQVTPGGLGLYEATLTGGLALYGVDPTVGLALAVATHALKFAYAYLAGLIALVVESSSGIGRAVLRQRLAAIALVMRHASYVIRHGRAVVRQRLAAIARRARLGASVDLGVVLATVAYLAVQPGAPTTAAAWQALLVGLFATAPLVVLGRCHHLPARLAPILVAVPALFLILFGLPVPVASLLAVVLAAPAAVGQRSLHPSAIPVAVVWPGLLAQSIAAGVQQPVAVALFGAASLVSLLLVRQWWLTNRPLPPPGPLPPGALVAVLIPVHDEAATIASVITGVPRALLGERGLEALVVVVDDGSTDGSAAIARAAGADVVNRHPTRRGLGAALRTALGIAQQRQAGAAVYLDGDGEYDPDEVPTVLDPIRRGEADYVLGSRFPRAASSMRPSRRLGNRAFTLLLGLLAGRRVADGQTGFRAFSARALASAEIIHDYNYAQVLTLDLLRKGMRLAEVPIRYHPRQQGTSFIRYREYLRRVLPAIAREVLGP